jgi:D-proline reductase (dithiol) PrdB
MPIDLESFKPAYKKWVEEALPFFEKGDMKDIVKKYPFVMPEDMPWTPYKGRPSEQTIALVTTGGLYLKDQQPPFDTESIHGDPGFREIPRTVRQEEIGIAHAHFDHSLAEQDINIIFPIQRLIELEEEGVVGKLADTHYSFSYVNDVEPLVTETAPEVIRRLESEGVDVLLLVPV